MTVTEITNQTHGCRETKLLSVCIPVHLSYKKQQYWGIKEVDACLAPVVNALNKLGCLTASCCCGHGVSKGSIILHDGVVITTPRCKRFDEANAETVEASLRAIDEGKTTPIQEIIDVYT